MKVLNLGGFVMHNSQDRNSQYLRLQIDNLDLAFKALRSATNDLKSRSQFATGKKSTALLVEALVMEGIADDVSARRNKATEELESITNRRKKRCKK